MKHSLFSFDIECLKEHFISYSLPSFAADQVYGWIYKQGEYSSDRWMNISRKIKEYVNLSMDQSLPVIISKKISEDGTVKFLIGFKDGKTVETVLIFSKKRVTLCLSTQVGCAVGCVFCYTGTMGLSRNLKVEEIVGQFLLAGRWLKNNKEGMKIDNIVYMGQGEPLHNFENVRKATMIFMEKKGIGLGQRKITLSTSGLIPQIEKLALFPPINMAVSLHSPYDEIRSKLIPKAHKLSRLFEAINKIPLKAHRWITYEYVLISGLNDREDDIDGLCRLLGPRTSKINLIPFNEFPESSLRSPSRQKISWFKDRLMKKGFICTVRMTKGDDILAACGQLKSDFVQEAKS